MNNELIIIEQKEVIHQKNEFIVKQGSRIRMLEEKLDEVRHKYFNLKMFISLRGLNK